MLRLTEQCLAETRGQLATLEARIIDKRDLAQAPASFEPVWEELFPREKERILQLLIEAVTNHAADGEVGVTFRPGGVRALAGQKRKSA